MGSSQNCNCCQKYRHTVIYLLILFASTSSLTQVRFFAEGRAISKVIEAAQKSMREQRVAAVSRIQIGSRPPRCERRCSACEHCEAVQVPVAPQVHFDRRERDIPTIAYSGGNDYSNYKPISWKCKCGDLFFNP
ncbi:EPIDERMAL PATTERNING FACTOR-like protein 2 [Quillaja saponaria]|uniref:Epidermal patterning factor-like protein n=1 Tax=Quillaja saponaria TaxID=32244 RepID=A0AAD7LX28_QUISA|nr:EPIDERMAL PATTERNING FACTOR-like protein 2 [Quillaja saponaria]